MIDVTYETRRALGFPGLSINSINRIWGEKMTVNVLKGEKKRVKQLFQYIYDCK